MSTRFAVAVVTLASIVAAAATADESYLLDIESVVGARLRPAPSAPLAASPVLRLVWVDPTGVGVGTEAVARDEARSLLRRMGASISWRRGDAREMARPGEVRVILLDRTAASFGKAVLGATPPRFEVAPFVWVHVPSVRAVIGLDPRGSVFTLPPRRRAPWRSPWVGSSLTSWCTRSLRPFRTARGSCRPRFTTRQLTAPSIPFEPEVGLAVRAALRGDPPGSRPDTGVLAVGTAPEPVLR